jgi:GNAT superfamily N-acetyltransferase
MTQYVTRRFDPSEEEYAAIVRVYNLANPHQPGSAASWQHWDKHRDPTRLFRRYVVEVDEEIIGYGFSMKSDPEMANFRFAIFLHPDHQTPELVENFYKYIIGECMQNEPASLVSQVCEDEMQKLDWLKQNGFQQVMRFPVSILDVSEFDPTPYDELINKLARQGIKILSLSELQEEDPGWQQRIYELDSLLNLDVPRSHPFVPLPFRLYAKTEFEDPHFMPEGWFVALDGRQYIGLTTLEKGTESVEILYTAFTGVHRAYRRRGIATALKAQSIRFASRIGTRMLQSNNEENNPMYLLNLKLGFQPQPADVDWEMVIK